jgi:hypothetical protein
MTKTAIKQKRVLNEMLKNGGKSYPAMVKAGYSPNYAKNPGKLEATKTWQELLEHDLPDDLLSSVAKEGLKATIPNGITGRKRPDYLTRQKYLETSLKMRGKLIDRHDITSEGEKVVGFTFVSPLLTDQTGKKKPI